MSRPPRIEVAGGIYHVVSRGNERGEIFGDAGDRQRFLEVLERVCERTGWEALCYCLMNNHYHLLVRTPSTNLQRGMRDLNGVYAQWFNRRHARTGHLFEGRYKAVLVQSDAHLLSTVRYILRNPARAGVGHRAGDWTWTSMAETSGSRRARFIAIDALLSYVAPSRAVALTALERLVASDDDVEIAHPLIDGDDRFVDEHLAGIVPSPEHPHRLTRPSRPSLAGLVALDAPDGIARAHRVHGYSMRQIATHLGVGVATVSRRIAAFERRHESAGDSPGTWET